MGNALGGVEETANKEFDELLLESLEKPSGADLDSSTVDVTPIEKEAEARDYLVIDEILRMKATKTYEYSFTHLGSLYALDSMKRGRFEKKDIHQFISLCDRVMKKYKILDFTVLGPKVRAYCTLLLWKAVCKDGQEAIVNWILRLFCENLPIIQFENYPNVDFINRFSVQTMYEILSTTHESDFQSFLDVLQRVAEEKGILKLDDSDLDDVLPVQVLKEFAEEFVAGFVHMMRELGFEPDMQMDLATSDVCS